MTLLAELPDPNSQLALFYALGCFGCPVLIVVGLYLVYVLMHLDGHRQHHAAEDIKPFQFDRLPPPPPKPVPTQDDANPPPDQPV